MGYFKALDDKSIVKLKIGDFIPVFLVQLGAI